MSDYFRFADSLGPEKIVHIYEPALQLKAIVVIDNTAAGCAIGGIRMALNGSVEECSRLARAMTFKNALAGLPHGGGKSIILADPSMPAAEKEQIVRAFAVAIRDLAEYVPGPDMGLDETAMAWVKSEIGRASGLPRAIGGIPLDEIGATGYGLCVAAEAAQEFAGFTLEGARIVIQGFGAVGRHAAQFFAKKKARLVGVSDSKGAIADPDGLDISRLLSIKGQGGSIIDYNPAKIIRPDDLIAIACEIWIPAARPDVLTENNVVALRTKLVLQGANIPATAQAEHRMGELGILNVPDILANAGGVITAAVEYRGGTEHSAFDLIQRNITANTHAVLAAARAENILPRQAAINIAQRRIESAMALRRWHL